MSFYLKSLKTLTFYTTSICMSLAFSNVQASSPVEPKQDPVALFENRSAVSYVIKDQEAVDMYDELGSAAGAYINENNARVLVKMHYEYFGRLSMRIRTEIVCEKFKRRCTVSGNQLVFIDYPSH